MMYHRHKRPSVGRLDREAVEGRRFGGFVLLQLRALKSGRRVTRTGQDRLVSASCGSRDRHTESISSNFVRGTTSLFPSREVGISPRSTAL